ALREAVEVGVEGVGLHVGQGDVRGEGLRDLHVAREAELDDRLGDALTAHARGAPHPLRLLAREHLARDQDGKDVDRGLRRRGDGYGARLAGGRRCAHRVYLNRNPDAPPLVDPPRERMLACLGCGKSRSSACPWTSAPAAAASTWAPPRCAWPTSTPACARSATRSPTAVTSTSSSRRRTTPATRA